MPSRALSDALLAETFEPNCPLFGIYYICADISGPTLTTIIVGNTEIGVQQNAHFHSSSYHFCL